MKQKSRNNNRSVIWLIAVLLSVVAAFTGWIIYTQVSKTQPAQTAQAAETSGESADSPAQKPTAPVSDAAKYYSENAQKVIAVTPAKASSAVYSEKDIGKLLSARGFGDNVPVTYEYNMDGSMGEKTEIDKNSAETHPQYTATFISKSGEYWTVNVCNGCVTAYPVNYNLEHSGGTEVIITESDSITAYDSKTNSFYEMIPKQSVLVIKHIPSITAEVLETLTAQEIDAL